jgi:hypothetical protein
MQTSLIITDLTRMSGDRVCVAGVTPNGRNIRPEFEQGVITEDWLYDDEEVVVRPFAKVKLNLLEHCPEPPHTEDWNVQPDYRIKLGLLKPPENLELLKKILDPDVTSVFGAEIQHNPGNFIREGEGNRSLGTIKVRKVFEVVYNCDYGRWEGRINFVDQSGSIYRLKVTDLSFGYFLNYLRMSKGQNCDEISNYLTQQLQKSEVFLRIGLARPTWEKHPHCCFLQINGVYTFPDYLQGRCFADFRPPA